MNDTGLTDQRDSVYSLWGCFTPKLKILALDNKLDEDADLNEDEERFHKQVRKLAVSLPVYYAKEVFVKVKEAEAKEVEDKKVEAKEVYVRDKLRK